MKRSLTLSLLLLAGTARAAPPPAIAQVKVGLPGGTATARSRNGAWAPVYVTLKAGENIPQGTFRLAVESTDGEEMPYRYTVPVPALAAGEERVALAYARPGTDGSEFTVKVQDLDGHTLQTSAKVRRDSSNLNREVVEPHDVLYLILGSRLPGLRRAVQPQPAGNDNEADDPERGARGFAVIEDTKWLPDRWFGYMAADVVLLTTGSEGFIRGLLEDRDSARRDALVGWVQRGGRLVVSVGRNHQLVGKLLEKLPLLNCGIKGSVTRAALPNVTAWAGREAQQAQQQPLRQVEIACLAPGSDIYTVVLEDADGSDLEKRPIIVQAPCGLGRVLLVAFDLDGETFSKWEGQAAFWKKLQTEAAPRLTGKGERGELADDLQRSVETFGEVPVISFGWVALFLLIYIILVGPLDYFVLKRVFKRLELTWVTFPLVVLGVSVAAYVTAYSLKGDDLWINKVDLVEVDLHGTPQVYGSTWFALFNPRSQSFTVGLEPASPGWAAPGVEPAVLAPLEGPLRTVPGSPGLFRRPYEYVDESVVEAGAERVVRGLRGMPVPVWATRAFTASWRAPGGPSPPIEADVRLSRDGAALAGTIVNHLPVELQGVGLFFRGQWYTAPVLMPGQRLEVQSLFERGVVRKPASDWFTDPSWLPRIPVAAFQEPSRPQVLGAQKSYRPIKAAMFYNLSGNTDEANSGLRTLDQSWRLAPLSMVPTPRELQYLDEAILVGRAPSLTDRAEAVTAGGASPSRLWLDALPGKGSPRPALEGHLSQETYVRVYIPVRKDR